MSTSIWMRLRRPGAMLALLVAVMSMSLVACNAKSDEKSGKDEPAVTTEDGTTEEGTDESATDEESADDAAADDENADEEAADEEGGDEDAAEEEK